MTTIEWRDTYIYINLAAYNIRELLAGKLLNDINIAVKIDCISLHQLQTFAIVFSTLHEGHGVKEYEAALQSIKDQSWYNESNTLWLNNVIVSTDYKHISLPFQMTNHCEFLNFTMNLQYDWQTIRSKLFVCLMRRPSPSRANLYQHILKSYSADDYTLSFCSMPMLSKTWRFDNNSPEFQRLLFAGPADQKNQHEIDTPLVFQCLVNCVVETSNQLDAEQMPVYNTIFITEKTFKAFAWRQIPLWFAVPGTVQAVRAAGFDLFDDLVDHSYDSIIDQDTRFWQVFNQLDKLAKLSLDQLSLRLQSRFEENFKTLVRLNDERMRQWHIAFKRIKEFSLSKKISG